MSNASIPPWKRIASCGLLLLIASALAGFAAQDEKDRELEALRRRVRELEAQVAELQRPQTYTESELAAEENLLPDINTTWRSEEIGPLIGRLETESREIFTERFKLAAVVGPPPGAVIADIGAGSGFMTNIFARQVGPEGTVYAVDINAVLMGHVAKGAAAEGLDNVEIVVCTDKSAELPDESVDLVFICDTYHHFEYPKNTMTSIWRALRPGGQVVIVDFHRIEGVSRPFIMQHVRDGQEVFTQEILDAGFELANDHDVDFLTENYVIRFRKVGNGADLD